MSGALAPVAPLGPLLGGFDELYLTFQECPHDALPPGYEDGDNSVLAGRHLAALEDADRELSGLLGPAAIKPSAPAWLAAQGRRVIVPHPRDIRFRDAGADVLALQRALAARRLRRWGNFTRAAGRGVVSEVEQLQHQAGQRATGVYDEAAHRALAPFYDAYGVFLLLNYQAASRLHQAQQAALAACMTAYNYRGTIHYTEGSLRWMMIASHVRAEAIPAWRALYADCSSWFTWIYWTLGLPDPNLLNFTGGFTGTLGEHGAVVAAAARAPIGSAYLYGGGAPYKHVQFGVGGEDTIGNGSEAGPLYLPAGYRGDLDVVRSYPGLS